jgi:hypothetical protein
MRLALEDWLAKSGKIITHTDIARAVNERLNPKVRDQIQALRNANRFSPQAAVAAREIEGEDDQEDSWELPTAVSGLIQLPEDIAREAAPSPRREPNRDQPTVPVPSKAGSTRQRQVSANDTQPSIAPEPDPELTGSREATRRSNDHKLGLDKSDKSERTPPRPEPERASAPRSQESNGVASTPVGRDERKRQILLALAVVVLVVLSFLAGRL